MEKNKTEVQPEVQPPVLASKRSLTLANGQTYDILRYKGRGPNLEETMAILNEMRENGIEVEMLTHEEANEIRDNKKSNSAFTKGLGLGEWGYVLNSESKESYPATVLGNYKGGRYGIDVVPWPSNIAARVVILKHLNSEATAPKTNSKSFIRLEANSDEA